MKHFVLTIAILFAGISSVLSAQDYSNFNKAQGPTLSLQASSVVLFSDGSADKGTENPMGNISVIAGYRVSPYLGFGFGFGFDADIKSDYRITETNSGIVSENTKSATNTPLFIQMRSDFIPSAKVCPFVSVDLGYRAVLTRAVDENKGAFYVAKGQNQDATYDRYYNSGAFAQFTLGVGFNLGENRMDIGASYCTYQRQHTTMTLVNGKQSYNTVASNMGGLSFRIGITF
ncbi:MAG: hypothetical protein MJZ16_07580 [Bacteroidales bacterium]|nr:hypothetical protein [Bacteroidales bacterium]